jgi:hypothetical protein
VRALLEPACLARYGSHHDLHADVMHLGGDCPLTNYPLIVSSSMARDHVASDDELIWKDQLSSGFLHVPELGPRISTSEFLRAPAHG